MDEDLEGYTDKLYKEWIPEEVQGYHYKDYYEWTDEIEPEDLPPPKTFSKIIQGEEPLD